MPKIATYRFLTFFLYSFDVLNEPPHIHVVKEKNCKQRSAKIWLYNLKIANRGSFSKKEMSLAIKVIKLHKKEILFSFQQIQQGKRIKTINFR